MPLFSGGATFIKIKKILEIVGTSVYHSIYFIYFFMQLTWYHLQCFFEVVSMYTRHQIL